MYTDKQELLNTQLNADEANNSNSSKLIERESIDNSPFYIVGAEDKGYFLTIGKFKLTDNQPSKLDVILQLENEKWEIILKLIHIVTGELNQIEHETKQ